MEMSWALDGALRLFAFIFKRQIALPNWIMHQYNGLLDRKSKVMFTLFRIRL